jgi:hypothetical protein
MLAGAMLGLPFDALPGGLDYKPGNGAIALLEWPLGAERAAGLDMLDTAEEETE